MCSFWSWSLPCNHTIHSFLPFLPLRFKSSNTWSSNTLYYAFKITRSGNNADSSIFSVSFFSILSLWYWWEGKEFYFCFGKVKVEKDETLVNCIQRKYLDQVLLSQWIQTSISTVSVVKGLVWGFLLLILHLGRDVGPISETTLI